LQFSPYQGCAGTEYAPAGKNNIISSIYQTSLIFFRNALASLLSVVTLFNYTE